MTPGKPPLVPPESYADWLAQHCPGGQFGQQPADQLPWFHIVTRL